MRAQAFRLGFAVKVLGGGGMATHDARRHASGPSLAVSLDLLEPVFAYLDRIDVRVYRLSSSTIPYGTHPDMPEFDFRRQIADCADRLTELGAQARRLGLRLSTHPGQYTRINALDRDLARHSARDIEQDAALLDALGCGAESVIVTHVGSAYGDPAAALDRWAAAYADLPEGARSRLVVEHDEREFDVEDVLALHARTGVRVIFDHHHHRCLPASRLSNARDAMRACLDTWPAGVRPKVHLSSPRTELRVQRRKVAGERKFRERLVPPLLDQHADFATPWDLLEVLRAADRPVDVMIEAKAKDLAVLWLRDGLARIAPEVAGAEMRA